MKQKSGWKRITLLRKTSFNKRLKILAGYKRQLFDNRTVRTGGPVDETGREGMTSNNEACPR
jgi:hypothetical protein